MDTCYYIIFFISHTIYQKIFFSNHDTYFFIKELRKGKEHELQNRDDNSNENTNISSEDNLSISSGSAESGALSTVGGQTINSSTPANTQEDPSVLVGQRNVHYHWSEPETDVLNKTYLGKVEEMVNRVRGQRIDMVYKEPDLFVLFMNLVVKHVVFKRKWNANSMTKKYYHFVTVSDEAFAFLVLENNAARYLDMADERVEKTNYACPKYTDAVLKGERRRTSSASIHNLPSRGWTDEGKLRFMNLFEEVEKFRETEGEKVESLAKYLLEKETTKKKKRSRKKRGAPESDDETEESSEYQIVENSIECNWNKFLEKTSCGKKKTSNHHTSTVFERRSRFDPPVGVLQNTSKRKTKRSRTDGKRRTQR